MSGLQELDPTRRFGDRVAAYERFRPSYPDGVIAFLRAEPGLTPEHVVADVGSGTGLLSRAFLQSGNLVYGVEPNAEMRGAAERLLGSSDRFVSVEGRAEATGLPPQSVDFVAAGQAFHWFDPVASKAEFRRILRSGGWTVLVWNSRRTASTEFLSAYEAFLRSWCPDYGKVSSHYEDEESLALLFGADGWCRGTFEHTQSFDYHGLEGRLLSSSYAPGPEEEAHGPMLAALRQLFDDHERGGRVVFEYDTGVYAGRLTPT